MDYFINAAIDIAKRCHAGQVRKYTNEPYIAHPFAVAGLVASVTDDEDMIVAAILHDTVEDSDITVGTIRGIFGKRIASLVDDLTDISLPEHGNRKIRKAIDRAHTGKASPAAKTIKLADLIDNSKTIVKFDPKFASVYMEEKRLLLDVLRDGDKGLHELASGIVRSYYSI